MILLRAFTVVMASILAAGGAYGVESDVPLPRPRPASAVPAGPALTFIPLPQDPAPSAADEQEAIACRARLTRAGAIAADVPPLTEPGGCGASHPVRLDAVILADRSLVSVTPPALLRCPMAEEMVRWISEDASVAAQRLGSALRGIANYDSYGCRPRNRVIGGKLSEHGRANALDIRSLSLADGRVVELTDRTVPRDVREFLRARACLRFSTILGPGSDGYHESHIHFDLAQRRGGYKLCHWDILDPLPEIPVPRPRPQIAAGTREDGDAQER